MTQEVTYEFKGTAAQLLAEYQKLAQAKEDEAKQYREAAAESRKAAQQQAADQREAQRVIKDTQTALEVYNDKVKRLGELQEKGHLTTEQHARAMRSAREELRKSQKQTDDTKDSYVGLMAQFATSAIVIGTITQAFRAATQEQMQFREETRETAQQVDELTRKLAVQAGFTKLQSRQERDKVLAIAAAQATTEEQAFAGATELISQGFSDATGGTLGTLLQIQQSANLQDTSSAELAKSFGQFLAAFGLDKNQENLQSAGIAARGLFKDTKFQVSDLQEFAKVGNVFQQAGIDPQTALATLNTIATTRTAAEAGTAGRNIIQSLTTASAQGVKTGALAELGLQPGDVDLIGERLPDVLELLASRLDALPEEQRAPTLTRLFSAENAAAASYLLANRTEVQRQIASQNDAAGFFAGAELAQSGPAADARRADVQATQIRLRRERTAYREQLQIQALNELDATNNLEAESVGPVGNLFANTALGLGSLVRNTSIGLGADRSAFLTPEQRASIDQRVNQEFGGDVVDRLDRLIEVTEKNAPKNAPQQPPAAQLGRQDK